MKRIVILFILTAMFTTFIVSCGEDVEMKRTVAAESMGDREFTRDVYWEGPINEEGELVHTYIHDVIWIMYILLVITFSVLGYGIYKLIKFWKLGQPDPERKGNWGKKIWFLIRDVFLQRKLFKKWMAPEISNPLRRLPGLMHVAIFWGFLFLAFTTFIITVKMDLAKPIGTDALSWFHGYLYILLSLGSDILGALAVLGILFFLARRYITKQKQTTQGGTYLYMSLIVLAILVTGFFLEGARIAWAGDPHVAGGDAAHWTNPIGIIFAPIFAGASATTQVVVYNILWWGHMVLAFTLIASLPFTRLVHIFVLPANIMFTSPRDRGMFKREDIEEAMANMDEDDMFWSVGNRTPLDFTWKQLMDFDACIGCGRCEAICPAAIAQQPFSPKKLIESCRDFSKNHLVNLLKAKDDAELQTEEFMAETTVIPNALDEQFVWLCRTCMACVEVCPASINHVDTFIEIRRSEVMMDSRMPDEALNAANTIERLGNPFEANDSRVAWMQKLSEKYNIPIVGEGEEVDYLYFVGCTTSFDQQKQKIAEALLAILSKAGVSVGLLGDAERCCGDPVRITGDEYRFQALAKEQYELITARKFKKLLLSCPHGLNVFGKDYAMFGMNLPVIHHSQLLCQLIQEGKIKLDNQYKEKIVYHDPCYLSRYLYLTEEPRNVLSSIPGAELKEANAYNKKNSYCCGAGGGHYFMDIMVGERINNIRVNQLAETGASKIITACPMCNQMLTDSVALLEMEDKIKVIDIAMVVATAMGIGPAAKKEAQEEAKSDS